MPIMATENVTSIIINTKPSMPGSRAPKMFSMLFMKSETKVIYAVAQIAFSAAYEKILWFIVCLTLNGLVGLPADVLPATRNYHRYENEL